MRSVHGNGSLEGAKNDIQRQDNEEKKVLICLMEEREMEEMEGKEKESRLVLTSSSTIA
jgi:hypothetical protein